MLYLAKPSFFETPCRIHFSTKSISRKNWGRREHDPKLLSKSVTPRRVETCKLQQSEPALVIQDLKKSTTKWFFLSQIIRSWTVEKTRFVVIFLKTLGLLIFLTWVTLKASGIMDKTWRSNQSLDPKALKSRTINLSVILNCERGIQFDLQNWAKFDQFPSVDSCLESYTTIVFFEFVSYY